MIYGTLATWRQDSLWLPQSFDIALDFMQHHDALTLPTGRYDIAEGIFALVQDAPTQMPDQRRFELHRAHTDIQLLLSGHERQLYAPDPLPGHSATLLDDKPGEEDIAFYARPPLVQAVLLKPGDYVVYLPGELHCPCCVPEGALPGTVRKVVFKIRKPLPC